MLEPNPAHCKEAMRNPHLKPFKFWIESEQKDMDGLWRLGCCKRWKRKDLLPTDRVFGSSFHYNIKHDGATGHITNCKVQLVVQGN
eukprot:862938-Rhodomonas_salina.3